MVAVSVLLEQFSFCEDMDDEQLEQKIDAKFLGTLETKGHGYLQNVIASL
jgi:hypothetical protein